MVILYLCRNGLQHVQGFEEKEEGIQTSKAARSHREEINCPVCALHTVYHVTCALHQVVASAQCTMVHSAQCNPWVSLPPL